MMKNRFYWLMLSTICTLIVVAIVSLYVQNLSNKPRVVEGVLDLSNWEFERDGIVELKGQWGFTKGIAKGNDNSTYKHFANVPGDMPFTQSKGAGTYYIKILLPSNSPKELAIDVEGIRLSHQLIINGELIHSEGQPANSRQDYKPRNIPYDADFSVDGNELNIQMPVANFDYYKTGIHLPIYLGTEELINKRQVTQDAFDSILFIVFLVLAFIFIAIYFSLIKEKATLYLSGYFFTMSILLMTTNQKILLQLFPQVPFLIFVQIRDFTMYMSILLLYHFTINMFRNNKKRASLLNVLAAIYLIYCIAIMIIPYQITGGIGDRLLFPLFYALYIFWPFYVLRRYLRGDESVLSKRELEYFILYLVATGGIYYSFGLYYANVMDYLWLSSISTILAVIFIVLMFFEKFRKTYLSMEHYAARLERENQLKDEFLFRTSHELKTPLHGIINLAQISLDSSRSNDTVVIEKNNHLIKSTALRMAKIVNDLVDFSLIKENKFRIDLQVTDLLYCVNSVVEVLDYLARERNSTIQVRLSSEARYALVDEARFIQVIYNLVQNSLQHTKGGTITISSKLVQKQIRLTVEDTGTGIPVSEQETIFKPYEQGSYRLNSGGLGLGLAISKQLVMQMKGSLVLEWSEVGKGSRFAIYVDQAQPTSVVFSDNVQEKIVTLSANTRYIGANATILIVDDEQLNRQVLREILKYQDFNFIEAENGQQVFDILAKNIVPDIILLDVMLDDMTGYDICRQIRETYSLIEIPILFITVNHSIRDISQAFLVGGNDFLTKPFEAEEVRARVDTLLQMKTHAKKAAESEMAFLQSQIKPHFLFNTLSAVMAYSYDDPEKTRTLLESLSSYLRTVFQTSHQTQWVTLKTELELTEAFVAIQEQRYGERLHVTFDVNKELLNYFSPPLLLQPLVENAISHGVLKRNSGGFVVVVIEEKQDGVQVSVQDNGVGISQEKMATIFSEKSTGSGVGLANVQKRILRFTKRPLVIDSEEKQGTTISYWLPKMSSKEVNDR